jgi:hypothetical protein
LCLYTWRIVGLADEAGFDAMPDAAGGEAVTGPLTIRGNPQVGRYGPTN